MLKTRHRYNLVLTGLLLTGFIFTSWFSLLLAKQSAFERIENDALPLTSHLIHTDLEKQLLAPVIIASQMANNTFLHHWIESAQTDSAQLFKYLQQTRHDFDAITSFLALEKEQLYYRYDNSATAFDPNDTNNKWFKEALENPAPYTMNVDFDQRDNLQATIYINHKVIINNEVRGIAGIGIKLGHLQTLLESYQTRYGRKVYFIDHQDRLLFYGDTTFSNYSLADKFNQHQNQIQNNESYRLRIEHDAYTSFIHSQFIAQFGWHLIVEQTLYKDASFTNTFYINLFIGLTTTLIILFCAQLAFNHYQKRLERMATYDKLTNTLNRQAFEPYLQAQILKAKAEKNALSILMLDIDHFKQVNDKYGHLIGDKALQHFAKICRDVTKQQGCVCRWGGEEFVILLPNKSLKLATRLAEKLHAKLQQTPCEIKLTTSIGLAEFLYHESLDEFLKRADDALYKAKHLGRNRSELAEAA